MSVFCTIDDKAVPLYRVMWVSRIPHFCGHPDCEHEGDYEVRLEQGESLWAKQPERDNLLEAIELWHEGREPGIEDSDEEDEEPWS